MTALSTLPDSPRRCPRCHKKQLLDVGEDTRPDEETGQAVTSAVDVCTNCDTRRPVVALARTGRWWHHAVQEVQAHNWTVWDTQGRPADPDHSGCDEKDPCRIRPRWAA